MKGAFLFVGAREWQVCPQQQWAEIAVEAVYKVFPPVKVETWKQCERYLPHGLVCGELISRYALMFEDAARLMNSIGVYLENHALYGMAIPLLEQALKIHVQVLGEEHPYTALSLNNLGYLYDGQGRLEEAKLLYKRALAICIRILGRDHPNTFVVLNNYVALLQKMHCDEEATEL